MNLIEQLGGYAQAKALRSLPAATYDCGIKFNREELELSMLEHRRQQNIYEVGDKVVAIGEDYLSTIMTVERVTGRALECFESGYIFTFQGVRHATDAEIKAGRRLP